MEAFAKKLLITLGLAATLSACSGAQKRPDYGPEPPPPEKPQEMGPPEAFGPTVPAPVDPNYGPEPIRSKAVVLVLGPGMARAYAGAGVIKGLQENHIGIAAVLGTEMGAFIGAAYALSGSVNKFEWSLTRFRADAFERSAFAIGREKLSGGKLQDELDDIFGAKEVQNSRVPLRILLMKESTDSPTLVDRGSVADALRAALSPPELMDPGNWDGRSAFSAARARPFAVSEAKLLGLGPVVAVDALDEDNEASNASSEERAIAQQMRAARRDASGDLKDADIVIRPELQGIGYLDFQRRTDAAFRGKSAVNKRIGELRALVGLARSGNP